MVGKDFLSITDLSAKEIWDIFHLAKKLKEGNDILRAKVRSYLKNISMVMLFEKPSLRTKLSFDVAMNQLGGHSIYFGSSEVGLGKRESVADVGKVISSMADLIVARVVSHKDLQQLAQNSSAPVINALSDVEHPAQALTDLFTIWEIKGTIKGLTIAYVGDGGNNVVHSLCIGASMLGMIFVCGSPKRYFMNSDIVKRAKEYGGKVIETVDPKEAVKNADVLVTDTWVSMGDEEEKDKRLKIFKPYQVNNHLISLTKKNVIFMHCLPAYRGNEVTSDVIDGPKSVVFQEAENRLHVQKALILKLMI